MKETSLYSLHAGNTDAIAASLANVSEILCVQLSITKINLIRRTLNSQRQETIRTICRSHLTSKSSTDSKNSKVSIFTILAPGTKDLEKILLLGQQTLLKFLKITQHLRLAL